MFNWKSLIKAIFVFGLVIIVSIFEFSSAFSDLGPNETIFRRIAGGVLVLFTAAVIIGFLYPKRWYLSVLPASMIVIGGLFLIIFVPSPPLEIPDGVQSVHIKISEGQIELNPSSVMAGGFYVEQVNEGIEEHELAFFDYPKSSDITQMTFDTGLRASLRPLSPGEKNIQQFAGNYFRAGQYIVVCLKSSQNGASHISNGEIVTLTIE